MAYLDPTDSNTVSTTDSNLSELWSFVLERQKQAKEGQRFMVNDDGSTIRFGGNAVLLLPGKDGKITDTSVQYETDYLMRLRSMGVKERKALQIQLKNAGYLGRDYIANGLLDVDNAFLNASLLLARSVSAENYAIATDETQPWLKRKPISTDDYIKLMSSQKSGYSRTSTQRSISSFTDGESRSILESFYGEALGRRPSDDEVAKFKKAINNAAKANPNVTTMVSGANTTSTTSKEGYSQADAELSARKMAESQVGAAGYISSTKYMDAFLSVLGGKIGRV